MACPPPASVSTAWDPDLYNPGSERQALLVRLYDLILPLELLDPQIVVIAPIYRAAASQSTLLTLG